MPAYKESEERAEQIKPARGAKTQMITQAIEKQVGEFTLSDIEKMCPAASRDMIKIVFRDITKEQKD